MNMNNLEGRQFGLNGYYLEDRQFGLHGNCFEESCCYTDSFVLKNDRNTYTSYINFCKSSDEFQKSNPEVFLNDYELEYFKSLAYERRINSFLLGRFSAKMAISALTGEKNMKKILIKNGAMCHPIVVCDSFSNTHVSISHCDNFGTAIAFDDELILGIDVEKTNLQLNKGVEKELTQQEKELAKSIPYPYEIFTLMIWVLKESLSKALKTGLTIPLSFLEVKNIEVCKEYLICTYTNFPQYKSILFDIGVYICSITYPRNFIIDINLSRIKNNVNALFFVNHAD